MIYKCQCITNLTIQQYVVHVELEKCHSASRRLTSPCHISHYLKHLSGRHINGSLANSMSEVHFVCSEEKLVSSSSPRLPEFLTALFLQVLFDGHRPSRVFWDREAVN